MPPGSFVTSPANSALCVEARHGRLSVFMPPTQRLEDYLDLVEAIEATCAALEIPVLLEGYLPPPDDRIRFFKVTPDPGVIEVNTQPSESWEQLETLTETLYGVARECRLGTEKFDLNGRHTGTGGGNHVVLGGPTSQAPRMDESRRDAVYEAQIALAQLPPAGTDVPPWLVDRLFRDLLVDLTGNTHRAELCIDKLYSPEGVAGRLGLVELRGIEMPPHWQMSLAQQLLVRAAIAAFWKRPYREPLADWGTALYDRFMLPHFVWRDLCDLIGELSRAGGVDLKAEWFVPHHEFRFPKVGDVAYDGVELEFRSAIEPWYVLDEEPGTGSTARYVDSSVERMQLSASGFDPSRHAVLCGGVRVPMHRTGTPYHFVARIRYRAWQPPRCLHPTIPVQTPLRFDLVDLKAARSIGGCTYHAYHPAGVNYERFPVNANEAEARRSARFETRGLSGGRFELPERPPHPGVDPYPLTLDLRRFFTG